MVGIWNGNERSQMHHCVTSLHCLFDTVRVADVAGEYLKPASNVGRTMIQPTPTVEGVVEHEGTYFVAISNQGFGKVRAYEAIGTGNEDGLIY
jgi:hypothetical protein